MNIKQNITLIILFLLANYSFAAMHEKNYLFVNPMLADKINIIEQNIEAMKHAETKEESEQYLNTATKLLDQATKIVNITVKKAQDIDDSQLKDEAYALERAIKKLQKNFDQLAMKLYIKFMRAKR